MYRRIAYRRSGVGHQYHPDAPVLGEQWFPGIQSDQAEKTCHLRLISEPLAEGVVGERQCEWDIDTEAGIFPTDLLLSKLGSRLALINLILRMILPY